MGYVEHAKKEFKALGWIDADGDHYTDDMQEVVCKNTLELLEVLADQHYSGATIGYALNLFTKLAQFKPLGPLTGDDSEWIEIKDNHFQNTRRGSVFKKRGFVYDVDGRCFRYGVRGGQFTRGWFSRIPVTFPYTAPKRELITLPRKLIAKELSDQEFAKELEKLGHVPYLCPQDSLKELGIEIISETLSMGEGVDDEMQASCIDAQDFNTSSSEHLAGYEVSENLDN